MTGHGLQLRMETAGLVDVGFVTSEFVLAGSQHEASRRALDQIRIRLQRQAEEGGIVLGSLSIEVDEVARSMEIWKLVRPEGFIFFMQDESAAPGKVSHSNNAQSILNLNDGRAP